MPGFSYRGLSRHLWPSYLAPLKLLPVSFDPLLPAFALSRD
jgi:hypothetical protein